MKRDFEKQIDRYLNGELDEDETFELLQKVGQTDENADTYSKACIQHQHLEELFEDSEVRGGVLHKSILMWLVPIGAIAILLIFSSRLVHNPKPPFATVAQSVGAHWATGNVVRSGDGVEARRYKLTRGLVRFDFLHGATMTVQGPADFEIHDAMHVAFTSGIATFDVPEAAIGFTVDTESANIIDLGTAFGIACGPNGKTDLSVFEGEVSVHQTNKPETRVREGESVRAGDEVVPVAYNTATFEDAWPLNSGVLQTTGLLKFVSPGPGFTPGAFEDNQHITVFLERSKAKVPKGVLVDLVDPGEYRKLRRSEGKSLPPVRWVRSYLLQLDPVGEMDKHDPDKVRVRGQITFDSPIVGVIASHSRLRESDIAFGHPEGIYKDAPRGVEPPKAKLTGATGRDNVILTGDQRTLIVDFAAGSAVDQLRVLVENSNRYQKNK